MGWLINRSVGKLTQVDPQRKVAIVTGAGGGIGAAICRRLTAEGVAVVAWDSDAGSAERVRVEGAAVAAFEVDITHPAAIQQACQVTATRVGPPTLLVNCAGIREIADPLDLTVESWRRVMAVNLDGAFYCTQAVGRVMAESGGGAIVNIASIASLDAYANRTAYVASKTGLLGLTRSTALDLARHGIRVNAVAPGLVLTPLTEPHQEDLAYSRLATGTPLQRWGRADEIADAVAFLLSDRASYITGVLLPVDGGASSVRE
jgi:NAD(P)-dependent dehydrogenase (short-subunit alcohol dehydrogenase family)